jgi:two-component system, chemotaxis family, protein-glutamate methylesterase/glutaminase
MPGMSTKTVMLVDDSATVRRILRSWFDSRPKFHVIGEAEHGREAVEKVSRLRPDLVILDLSMPMMNGIEAAPLLIQFYQGFG